MWQSQPHCGQGHGRWPQPALSITKSPRQCQGQGPAPEARLYPGPPAPTPAPRVGKTVLPVSDRISLPNMVGRKTAERSLPPLKPTTSRHQLPPHGETRQLGEVKRIV